MLSQPYSSSEHINCIKLSPDKGGGSGSSGEFNELRGPSQKFEFISEKPGSYQFYLKALEFLRTASISQQVLIPRSVFVVLSEHRLATRSIFSDVFSGRKERLEPLRISSHTLSFFDLLDRHSEVTAGFLISSAAKLLTLHESRQDTLTLLTEYATEIHKILASDREYRKLAYAIQDFSDVEDLDQLKVFFSQRLQEVLAEKNLSFVLTSSASEERNLAYQWLRSGDGGRHNDPPIAPEYQNRRDKLYNESVEIYRRSITHASRFYRLSGETHRLGLEKDKKSLLARFAEENFSHTNTLLSSSPNKRPGNGIMMQGAHLEKLFFTETNSSQFSTDQQQVYKRAFTNWGDAYLEFPRASFIFLRGHIVVMHPSLKYRMKLGSHLERYALVIHNDHLNGSYEFAQLTNMNDLKKILRKGISPPGKNPPAGREFGLDRTYLKNFHDDGTRHAEIGLSNISTVYGGLVSGLPVGELPLFEWERDVYELNYWKDIRNHCHFGLLQDYKDNRKYQNEGREGARKRERDALLSIYENASGEIYGVAKGLFDLLELFFHRYAAWKSDATPIKSEYPRMMVELYRHHESLRLGADHSQRSQLCLLDRVDPTAKPIAIADPLTRRIFVRDDDIILPETIEHCDSNEFALWKRAISSLALVNNQETKYELAMIKIDYIPEENRI